MKGQWRLGVPPKSWVGLFLLFALACGGCGFQSTVKTSEQWYPNYSLYRIAPKKNIVVYVHGYGGSEETFDLLPYFEASVAPNATIMYFNYKTGVGENNTDSFGVIAERLRGFLQ